MKRIFAVLLALGMTVCLAGCRDEVPTIEDPVVVAAEKDFARVELTLPGEGWAWEEISRDGETVELRFWPENAREVETKVYAQEDRDIYFCGTDLYADTVTLNSGKTATVYHHGDQDWFDMRFNDVSGFYRAHTEGNGTEYAEMIMEILKTAEVGQDGVTFEEAAAIARDESGIDDRFPDMQMNYMTGEWTIRLDGGDDQRSVVVISDTGSVESIRAAEEGR